MVVHILSPSTWEVVGTLAYIASSGQLELQGHTALERS